MADVLRPDRVVSPLAWLRQPVMPNLQTALLAEVTWEGVFYAAVFSIGFILRMWDVGGRAMHHDESLHATYAWYLFKGRGYQYNPIMHGPLQFYVMSFFYVLFGDSEVTARLFAVLCGSFIVLLPLFLRKEMGGVGAMTASVVLAISPTFLYFSRFARDDIYLDFFSLLMVVALWSYVRNRKSSSVYLFAVAAALAMATMEAAYIMFFILGSFVLLLLLRDKIVGTSRGAWDIVRSIPVEVVLYSVAAFAVITVLLYSTFLSNPYGIWDTRHSLLSPQRQDILGGITYWLSQHGVARGGQPWFYYFLLFPLYEQFALIFGAAGAIWAIRQRSMFVTFLVYWTVLAAGIYSWAGEKMPWLFLHPLLPAILLASTFTGHLLVRLRDPGRLALVAVLGLLLVMEVHSAQALAYSDGANPTEMLVYVQTSNDVPHVAGEVLNLIHRMPRTAQAPLIQVDDSDLGGWPFEWYFRNLPTTDVSYNSNFHNPTAPVLLMLGPEYDIYNSQLSHRYVVSHYLWNWWFPEDYKGLTFDNGMCGTAVKEVHCGQGQRGNVFLKTGTSCPPSTNAGTNCSPIQTVPAINILKAVGSGETYQNLWNWFVFRKPFGARGDRMLYVYVRKDLVPHGSRVSQPPPTSAPPTESTSGYKSLAYHQLSIVGGRGSAQGQLLNPRGMAVGPRGNLFVADSGNHRVDIFSSTGKYLRSFGSTGKGAGEFNANQSPMDVAVASNGTIYVADWWGHRIEEFNAKLQFVRSWGHYATNGDYGFFGPRSIAVGANGDVYVADTGNRRIAVFSSTGHFLFAFGSVGSGPGQFDEPSAVTVGNKGDIYVADMWNSRVQRFDSVGHFLGSWPVASWQNQSYEEPYMTALSNGDIAVSDPQNRRIIEFTSNGKPLGTASSGSLNLPTGLASASGKLYVVDSSSDDVTVMTAGKGPKTGTNPIPKRTKAPPP